MTFAGWVHTNGNLYLSSNSTTYQSQITTPDSVFWNRKDRNNRLAGIFINNAAGTAVNLTFDSRSLSEAAFRTQSVSKFNSRLMTHAFGVKPLKLPLPTNMAPVTLVLPKDPADVQMVQDVKMAWKSDFYVTVKTGVFQIADTNTIKTAFCDSLVIERSAGLDVPSMGACRRIFKPRVNAFYEGREDLRPDLIDVHMDSLRIWSDSAPTTRSPRILYVAFSAPSISNASNDYLSVRLRGGAQLPKSRSAADTGGISVVTERPLYVLGDYNTTVWRPAALMADAISFLSNPPNRAMLNASPAASAVRGGTAGVTGWCDVMQQVMAQRTAKPTTVNAAILAGNSATPCDYARAGCASPAYGGGLENFPRFLENWGGVTFTYTGSQVSLYTNRYSTGLWGNTTNVGYEGGGYYTPPTRHWAFDVDFRFPGRQLRYDVHRISDAGIAAGAVRGRLDAFASRQLTAPASAVVGGESWQWTFSRRVPEREDADRPTVRTRPFAVDAIRLHDSEAQRGRVLARCVDELADARHDRGCRWQAVGSVDGEQCPRVQDHAALHQRAVVRGVQWRRHRYAERRERHSRDAHSRAVAERPYGSRRQWRTAGRALVRVEGLTTQSALRKESLRRGGKQRGSTGAAEGPSGCCRFVFACVVLTASSACRNPPSAPPVTRHLSLRSTHAASHSSPWR